MTNNKIIALIIVLAIGVGYLLSRGGKFTPNQSSNNQQQVSLSQTLSLPEGWKIISESADSVKIEKTVTSGIKPEVVYEKSTSTDASDPGKYANRLIAGAKSTIPSLVYATNKSETKDSVYTHDLAGYYQNKSQKIYFVQKLIIKGENVYTLTGSYTGDLQDEVSSIIDKLEKEKVSL